MKFYVLVAFAIFVSTVNCHADVVLSLSDIDVSAGDRATVTASVANPSNDGRLLTGFNFTLDTSAGVAGIEIDNLAIIAGTGFGDVVANSAPPQFPFDTSVSGNTIDNAGILVGENPLDLFTLVFDIDPGAVVGDSFNISFVSPSPAPEGLFLLSFAGDTASVNFGGLAGNQNGTISVVGVPEPNAALIVLAYGGLLACRRRR